VADSLVELTVVVPVYRCEGCLRELHRRLTAAVSSVTSSYELVFVDDRSPDRSWDMLRELATEDPRLRLIRFSRNFGQQAAITAGLAESAGRWTAVIDCDLQDPPELIPRLYEKAREGYDIVLARRKQRSHSIVRLAGARAYHWFLRMFLGTDISGEYGAFSLVSRKARDAFLTVPDRDRHYLPILFWLGFERSSIDFTHGERYAGESSYSYAALIRLAADGVFFQTTTLLRWIVYLGFGVSAAGVLLAIYFVISYFLFHPYAGWTSLGVLILLIGGFIIVSTGVTGLYIGKIFGQVKGRPLYIIDTREPAAASRPEILPVDEHAQHAERVRV
jgi:dolichol-phosphate mannosyltransferase